MEIKTKKIKGIVFSFINEEEFNLIYKDIFVGEKCKFDADSDTPFILDCGAHIGVSVLFFKKLYPKARIIAFEPNPNTFRLLKLNVKQNNLEDVELVNAAVADKRGEIDFYISEAAEVPWTWGDAGVKNKWYRPKDCQTINVSAVRLSSYIKQKVNLVKLDIEGMKEIALREIERKLSLVKELILEFHGSSTNQANRIEEILSILDKNNFSYTIKQEGKKIQTGKIKKTDPYWLTVRAKHR